MNVRQLIDKLSEMDMDLPVWIDLYGSFSEVGSVSDVTVKTPSPSWPYRYIEIGAAE